jgi:phosphatidylethanolamine-binding protein (PEBP) family uncharacterized protein
VSQIAAIGRPSLVATLILALAVAVAVAGCGSGSGEPETSASIRPARSTIGTIALSSPAFKPGGAMPKRYTCDDASVSPPLRWQNVPGDSAELLLLAIDLSGGRTDAMQWAVGALSPSLHGIATGRLPDGAVVGSNSAGKARWGGICGGKGRVHHVAFLLYALSRKLGLKAGFDPALVRGGLKNGTLARGLTLATYRRP